MPLIRTTKTDDNVYRSHAVTEIHHVTDEFTRVIVRSYEHPDGSGYYMERRFDRDYDDSFSLDDAYAWVAELPEFAEYVDERDALIGELAPTLTDEQAQRVPWAYPEWEADAEYAAGDRRCCDGVLYKCLQAHTSQAGWEPANAPSLWARCIQETPGGDVPAWEQPDSTNPFMTGDRVHFPTIDDPIYESTIDNNVWSPADYPQGWTLVE